MSRMRGLSTLLLRAVCSCAACSFAYVDIGTNNGDTITAFANNTLEPPVLRTIENALSEAYPAAGSNAFTPRDACVYAFEPNPQWTPRLKNLSAQLSSSVELLHVHVETAVVAGSRCGEDMPRVRLSVPDKNHEAASLEAKTGPRTVEVGAICLVDFLSKRLLRHGSRLAAGAPIVMRIDVEGGEYHLLTSLAVAGLARLGARLHVLVEWHRLFKRSALAAQLRELQSRDAHYRFFNAIETPRGRLPIFRNITDAKYRHQVLGTIQQGASLVENYEKVVAHMLSLANISLTVI